MKVADPAEGEDVDMGPVISREQQERVLGFLERAVDAKATVVTGGEAVGDRGFFVKPTVVADVEQDSEIVQNEVFGPVVTMQRFGSDDEAIAMANGVRYGLAASVFSRDVGRALTAARKLEFGTVWVNEHLFPLASEMPHGGFKESGYGKDMSLYSMEEYTRIKHVAVKLVLTVDASAAMRSARLSTARGSRRLLARELERFAERTRGRGSSSSEARLAARRRADELDGEVGRAASRSSSREATGARVVDVDGHEYVDFCLGDTGAMAGHAPPATVAAVAAQAARGATTMLPSEDAIWVGRGAVAPLRAAALAVHALRDRCQPFAIRLAREITQRPKILVFDYCYHGTVDETLRALDGDRVVARAGQRRPAGRPGADHEVVEFNDVEALEQALAHGDVACVLAEPALTNIGIVLPGARASTTRCAS